MIEYDFHKKLQFCFNIEELHNDEDLLNFILLSDEANFKNTGIGNRHNCHYYAEENPHWLRPVDYQHPWSVNVWAGITGSNLVGPYFIEGNLNGDKYLNFLRNELPLLLENVDLETRRSMWYQHDGAPAHFCHEDCRQLDL